MFFPFVVPIFFIAAKLFFSATSADPLHVVIASQLRGSFSSRDVVDGAVQTRATAVDTADTPTTAASSAAIPRRRRRIFLTNERLLLNLTNDDSAQIIDCELIRDEGAIRRFVTSVPPPRSEEDVFDARRSYADENGRLFGDWKRACERVGRRRRRANKSKRDVSLKVVYPGTNWCGPGDAAKFYDDLGRLRNSDKCCRAHDNCPEDIKAFQTRHHYFNYRPWTITHCTCDENLFNCLKNVAITFPEEKKDSDRIGNVFFKQVDPPCFRLERMDYCVSHHWSLLWCKKWSLAEQVAILHTYLEGEWYNVDNTHEIPHKPPVQNLPVIVDN